MLSLGGNRHNYVQVGVVQFMLFCLSSSQAMWTCPFTGEFGMFVGVAVLTHLKDTLMTMQSFEDLMEVSTFV